MTNSSEIAQNISTTSTGEPNILMSLLPMVAIFVIFYFILIRPQSKKQQEQIQIINNLKKGDKIVTIGGIIGQVSKVEDNSIILEVSKGVTLNVLKTSISEKLS